MRRLTFFLAAVSLVLFAEKALCHETTFSIAPASFNALRYEEMRVEEAAPLSIRRGRFLSVDPGKDWDPSRPQSWNMYSYVRNNPINRVDPTGRCGESAAFIGPRVPCAQSESKPKPQRGNSPAQGQEPGTTQEFPDGNKTIRKYGPDGRAVIDIDYHKPHDGAPTPHVHDWDWSKKPPRQPWRAPRPGEIPEPSKSTTIEQRKPDLQTIIGATIMSLGGTALIIMTGGGVTLQPNAAGVVIVPRTNVDHMPSPPADCSVPSPYCA